jgi:hypothetical protein
LDRVEEVEAQMAELLRVSEAAEAGLADKISVLVAQGELAQAQANAELAGVRAEHDAAIETLRKDFSKKSTTARLLLNEREEAVRALTQRVAELQVHQLPTNLTYFSKFAHYIGGSVFWCTKRAQDLRACPIPGKERGHSRAAQVGTK